jgi:ATP adenylyltransferase
MDEFRENLWAPWRMEYIHLLADKSKSGCFLCEYRDTPGEDSKNHVLWRTADAIVLMNKFPYTNGHLLIAPLRHKGELSDLEESEMTSLMRLARDTKQLLAAALSAQGFNIGINFGLCAGAGLPEHLHVHIVPRWNGDTNFMAVIGDVRVIPQGLDTLYNKLKALSVEMGLPKSGGAA